MVYAPLLLSLHLCLMFAVLARMAVRSPAMFAGVRVAIASMAVLVAFSAPLLALLLLVPLVAAHQLRFLPRVPDRLDLRMLDG